MRLYVILIRILVSVSALTIAICMIACDRTEYQHAGPPEKVAIAATILPDAALTDVAMTKGYYLQEGLEATLQTHQIGKQEVKAVLDGKADFATVAETPVMLSIMKGERIAIIATIDTSYENMAIVARKDRGVLGFADLKGKKVATTLGTIGEFFMDTILIANGISRKDIHVVGLPPDKLQNALENGEFDAITVWTPMLIHIQKKLGDRVATIYGGDLYTQFYVIVAREEYIRKHPTTIVKLLKALVKAEEFVSRNTEEAQKIVADVSRTDIPLVQATWAVNNFHLALDQSLILALEDESQWAIKNGLTKAIKVPNYLDFIYFDGLKSVKPEVVRILR